MRNESVKWKIWIYRLLPLLAVAEVVLFLVSWLINAAAPELPVRSLLSSEGIRWFIGSFVANLQRPLLVWIVLCCIAVGCLRDSSLLMHIRQLFRRSHLPSFRQRLAFQFVLAELVAFVIILFQLMMCMLGIDLHDLLGNQGCTVIFIDRRKIVDDFPFTGNIAERGVLFAKFLRIQQFKL